MHPPDIGGTWIVPWNLRDWWEWVGVAVLYLVLQGTFARLIKLLSPVEFELELEKDMERWKEEKLRDG